jgi:hypothetical protein
MVSSAWTVCELSGNHAKADEKPEYEFSLGNKTSERSARY